MKDYVVVTEDLVDHLYLEENAFCEVGERAKWANEVKADSEVRIFGRISPGS